MADEKKVPPPYTPSTSATTSVSATQDGKSPSSNTPPPITILDLPLATLQDLFERSDPLKSNPILYDHYTCPTFASIRHAIALYRSGAEASIKPLHYNISDRVFAADPPRYTLSTRALHDAESCLVHTRFHFHAATLQECYDRFCSEDVKQKTLWICRHVVIQVNGKYYDRGNPDRKVIRELWIDMVEKNGRFRHFTREQMARPPQVAGACLKCHTEFGFRFPMVQGRFVGEVHVWHDLGPVVQVEEDRWVRFACRDKAKITTARAEQRKGTLRRRWLDAAEKTSAGDMQNIWDEVENLWSTKEAKRKEQEKEQGKGQEKKRSSGLFGLFKGKKQEVKDDVEGDPPPYVDGRPSVAQVQPEKGKDKLPAGEKA
ncbi:Hypothetical protein D9617_15g042220 [Elsinoe fawcettii]|nr:Hypothetical protein D9617_15g042220 [Elsinoe fawcettii]